MARIRSIKPEFCTSAAIVELSIPCRLHFVMLWMYADDEGRGVDHPLLIKAAIWPLDEVISAAEIELWQAELEAKGRIVRYESGGRRYFEIQNFGEHQRPNRPSASAYPPPPCVLTEVTVSDHGGLTEGSVNAHDTLMEASQHEIPHTEKVLVQAFSEDSLSPHGGLTAVVGGGAGEGEGEGGGAPRVPSAVLADAVELLLLRLGKFEIAKTKANPASWLVSARRGLRSEHHDRANALFVERPGITADELADELVPPIEPEPKPAAYREYIPEGTGNGLMQKAVALKHVDDEIGPES